MLLFQLHSGPRTSNSASGSLASNNLAPIYLTVWHPLS